MSSTDNNTGACGAYAVISPQRRCPANQHLVLLPRSAVFIESPLFSLKPASQPAYFYRHFPSLSLRFLSPGGASWWEVEGALPLDLVSLTTVSMEKVEGADFFFFGGEEL